MSLIESDDFVTDAELIRRLNVPEKIGRAAIQELEKRHPGRPPFPQKDPLMGHRRFWPAVVNYFKLRHGLGGSLMAAPQWQEAKNETHETGQTGRSAGARSDLETPQETLDRLMAAAAGPRRKLSHKKPTLVAASGPTGSDPDAD